MWTPPKSIFVFFYISTFVIYHLQCNYCHNNIIVTESATSSTPNPNTPPSCSQSPEFISICGFGWHLSSSANHYHILFNLLTSVHHCLVLLFIPRHLPDYLPVSTYLSDPFTFFSHHSPSIFQGFPNEVFQEFLHHFIIVYNDDILIYSQNQAEHYHHVMQVLKKLREYHLYLKLENCEFHRDTV